MTNYSIEKVLINCESLRIQATGIETSTMSISSSWRCQCLSSVGQYVTPVSPQVTEGLLLYHLVVQPPTPTTRLEIIPRPPNLSHTTQEHTPQHRDIITR